MPTTAFLEQDMKLNQQQTELLIFWLRLSASCVFLGRAWQHLRWDSPLRTLLWSQDRMQGIVSGIFGIEWQTWVTSPTVDSGIQWTIRGMGVWLALAAVLVWTVNPRRKWDALPIAFGTLILGFVTVLYWMSMAGQSGMLIEHALQVGAPALLLWAIYKPEGGLQLYYGIMVAIALTFIGHGFYAAGIHPTPGHFVTMIMNILGLQESAARSLLLIAGYVDLVVAAMLFIPALRTPALIYCAVWGGLTALARITAFYDPHNLPLWLDSWAYQTVYRVVHGAMPLGMYLAVRLVTADKKSGNETNFMEPAAERI